MGSPPRFPQRAPILLRLSLHPSIPIPPSHDRLQSRSLCAFPWVPLGCCKDCCKAFSLALIVKGETMVLRPPPTHPLPFLPYSSPPPLLTPPAPLSSPPTHSPGSADRCSVEHALVHKTLSVRCLAAVVTVPPGPPGLEPTFLEELARLHRSSVCRRYVRTAPKIRL